MSYELNFSWPQKKNNAEDSVVELDFDILWSQLVDLSNHIRLLALETGDKATLNPLETMVAICDKSIEPEKDWTTSPDFLSRNCSIPKKRYQHYLAADRQVCYFQVLYNSNRTIELQRLGSSEKLALDVLLHAKLASCIAWGYWHYSISLSHYYAQKSFHKKRASGAGQAGANYREEAKVFLRVFVRRQLKKKTNRTRRIRYDTAKVIASLLEPLLDDFDVDIVERGDDLVNRVDQMIQDEPELNALITKT